MFLDVAIGIFGAIIFANLQKVELSLFLILFGIISTLLVDLNLFVFTKKYKLDKFHHNHRELLHYPLIFIPVGFALVFIIFNFPLAILFTILSFLHFIHDSIGIGWGIQWLYPFSKKFYKFFSDETNELSTRFMISWTPEEQEMAAKKYGRDNWIKYYYFRPTPISVVEYSVFIISIIVLAYKIF